MAEPKTKLEWQIAQLTAKRRNDLKMTQKKLAEKLGVSTSYIGQVEMQSSPSMYSYDQLYTVAEELGCSLKDFMPEKVM
jgi:transcriptional regulator with XRE-family HTH domain